MRIAIITPLPPQHTGIADYVSDLVTGLLDSSLGFDLFTNGDLRSFMGINVFNLAEESYDTLSQYDVIIYHLGNNVNFHGYMIPLIKKYGGIVHLHDIVLNHLFYELASREGSFESYLSKIRKWYGAKLEKLFSALISNNVPPVIYDNIIDIPLFEEVIQYADACIVHSDFAREKIKKAFPGFSIYKVKQLYKMQSTKKCKEIARGTVVKFGVFGGVDPQKNLDLILHQFAKIKKYRPTIDFKLYIVGGISSGCEYIIELIKKLELEKNVIITGRVEEDVFLDYFNNIDVVIALRNPTMGETSAIVMRALQLSIPCIVNNVGWYKELPNHVIKINSEDEENIFFDIILKILEDNDYLNSLFTEAYNYQENNIDFGDYISSYIKCIKSYYNGMLNKLIYNTLGEVMTDIEYIDNEIACTSVISKVKSVLEV